MKLLLDTHVVLWAATEPVRLTEEAHEALADGDNEVFVSVVTAWEIAIKQSLGKLELPEPAERWLPTVLRRSGLEVAELDLKSALRVRALPWFHRDPFDRLLVAQALEQGLTLVSHDEAFEHYTVPLIRA